jgi:transcriptional regulator with PAS, ATPase and Fis domain
MANPASRELPVFDPPLSKVPSSRAPMVETLSELCQLIDQKKSSDILPTVFLLASDRKHLRLAAGPKVPEVWKVALKNLEFPADASFRSSGGYPGKAVWVADLRRDASFAECWLLAAHQGFLAAWSVPIFASDGEILGALILFCRAAQPPSDNDLKLVEQVTHMAATVIEGHRTQEAGKTAPESRSETAEHESSEPKVGGMIGESLKMQHVYHLIEKMSEHDCPVLILGESGTGKELVARATHYSGSRNGKPFIPVDCSTLVPTLIEAELFGYSRGAFTGATQSKTGLMEVANDGTLFLDEIGDLPMDMQSKFLRVLQEKELRRVGSTEHVPLPARIIAATNRDLEVAVRQGTFRQDLFFRLNVVQINLPPLRERKTDISALVSSFIEKFGGAHATLRAVSDEALTCLMAYDWPGNVRELANCIQRAIALDLGPILRPSDLPSGIRYLTNARSTQNDEPLLLQELTRREILRALHATEGDRCAAARILGIGKSTLYRKLREYSTAI